MNLERVWLQNFRNHENLVVEFDGKMTVVVGKNGSGKTNLLEGVYLLASGGSRRAGKMEEMVKWGGEVGRVRGQLGMKEEERRELDKVELEVVVTGGEVGGKKVRSKQLLVNGVGRSVEKYLKSGLSAVWFGPADMRLVEGSPTRRRGFMDECLERVYMDYARAVRDFEQGVRRRNKVLEGIRECRLGFDSLVYWDNLVLKSGIFVQEKRALLAGFFNEEVKPFSQELGIMEGFVFEYAKSEMSRERLDRYRDREVAAGSTLVGPHRDDFRLFFEGGAVGMERQLRDLKVFGSRGQQRMGVLWLKLGQLRFLEKTLGGKPMVLLDDIFSELDHEHRGIVLRVIVGYQGVISAADEHLVEGVVGKVVRVG